MKMPNLLVLVLRERKKLWCTRSLPDEGFWRPMTSPVQRMVETYDPLHPDLIIDNQGIHSCDFIITWPLHNETKKKFFLS